MRKHLSNQVSQEGMSDQPYVFLGGTINGSVWRDGLIELLRVAHHNPVVNNWTEDDIQSEHAAKAGATVIVYGITPKQHGYYVPVEAAVSVLGNRDKKVVLAFLDNDGGDNFTEHQLQSNKAIQDLLANFSSTVEVFHDLDSLAAFLNNYIGKQGDNNQE